MLTPDEYKAINNAVNHEFKRQWIRKNFFSLYSSIISTLALIVAIIALFR